MDVEFDPEKADSNWRKHRVRLDDAVTALWDPWALTIEDPDAVSDLSLQGERAKVKRSNTMRKNYDFSNAKRGAVASVAGKTRITIMLDDDVLRHFREQATSTGVGYQTLINAALRSFLERERTTGEGDKPVTVDELRRILREELHT
jgi:uncharacterized protein (DUF4415 family)